MGERRVLTDEELQTGLVTWVPKDHRPTTVGYALALALHSTDVARKRIAELEAHICKGCCVDNECSKCLHGEVIRSKEKQG